MSWSYYAASVTGTSHLKNGVPKQDYIQTEIFDKYFISIIADGAGTAKYSDISASLLCHFIMKKAKKYLGTNELITMDKNIIEQWIKKFQNILHRIKRAYHTYDIRHFASTMILSIISDSMGMFCQIGDGCIVINHDSLLKCVFWPQNGEYINTTNFVTDKNVSQKIMFKFINGNIQQLSVFTDGLENVALNFSEHKPYLPFFSPFFNIVPEASSGENKDLSNALSEFLNSELINKKTDDDKTIIFAIKGEK